MLDNSLVSERMGKKTVNSSPKITLSNFCKIKGLSVKIVSSGKANSYFLSISNSTELSKVSFSALFSWAWTELAMKIKEKRELLRLSMVAILKKSLIN
jgi:hypothetical protein